MTFLPVVNPIVLAALCAVIVLCSAAALLRIRAAGWPRKPLWRWAAVTSAAVLLALACWRPVVGGDVQARPVGDTAPSVFVVLDRSPDMRTDMAAARADVDALIDRYPGARFALVTFAAEPSLDWPLSADTWSLRPVVSAVRPYAENADALSQANAGAAGTVLRYQLISARQQYPRADNLVFYLGAGAPGSRLPTRPFDLPAGAVDGGAVLGYGTSGGGALQQVAGQIGVPFLPRADAGPLDAVLPQDTSGGQDDALTAARFIETYWAPAGIAAVLLLAELVVILREFRRTRSVDVGALR